MKNVRYGIMALSVLAPLWAACPPGSSAVVFLEKGVHRQHCLKLDRHEPSLREAGSASSRHEEKALQIIVRFKAGVSLDLERFQRKYDLGFIRRMAGGYYLFSLNAGAGNGMERFSKLSEDERIDTLKLNRPMQVVPR